MSHPVTVETVYNQPSYGFGTRQTRVYITQIGGNMAPVTFFADTANPIEPYFIAPWWNEKLDSDVPPLLEVLRGDFMCLPFGDNATPWRGQQYLPHGETANQVWEQEGMRKTSEGMALSLVQDQRDLGGMVRKRVAVIEGQSLVYSRHELSGMQGPVSLGHHPSLQVPPEMEGSLAFAPHRFAHTYVARFCPPEIGDSALLPHAEIPDLEQCPLAGGGTTDLTRWPARRGNDDLIMLTAREDLEFAWSALAVPEAGWLWFSLKDPRVLASTVLWMCNGGRKVSPWNGRTFNTIGVEEVTAFFHQGIAASAEKNFLDERGIPSRVMLERERALHVNFIQGVVRITPDFKGVFAIVPEGERAVKIIAEDNTSIRVDVDWSFLRTGVLRNLIE